MATLTHRDGRFVCLCSYDERAIAKDAGFRWDPERRYWYTTSVPLAATFYAVADPRARAQLPTPAAPCVAVAPRDIPVPAGLTPYPFQLDGVAYASSRPAVLLADEMGTGKTVQAILLANADPAVHRVLVVTTLSMVHTWVAEWQRWTTRPDLTVGIATAKQWPALTEVVVLHWDVLARNAERILAFKPDTIIADEIHKAKNPKSQRSKALYALRARRTLGLTGTPVVNRPVELQPILEYLQPGRWPFFPFAKRYCGAKQVSVPGAGLIWDFSGASHLDELQDKLRDTVMIRRLKRDVLADLPPKQRQIVTMDVAGVTGILKAEAAAYGKLFAGIAEDPETGESAETAALFVDPTNAEYAAAAEGLGRSGRGQLASDLAKARHALAVAKAPAVAQHVIELLEGGAEGGKVGIFAHHKAAIAKIQEDLLAAGVGVVTITGDGAFRDGQVIRAAGPRAEAQRLFQEDPRVRVFLGSITACAEGLTLTAADRVVFAELDWRPGICTQAEDRFHRIGQKNSVLVQHLVVNGSVDAQLVQTIIKKQVIIDAALDTRREVREA